MGRPRKVVKEANIVQEVITLIPSAAPVIGEENLHSHTGVNSNVKETTGVDTKVDPKPDVSKTVTTPSLDSKRVTRQSDRLKRKPEPDVRSNLVECKAKEPKLQDIKSPTPDEVISEQELPPDDNSNNMEAVNADATVHHDSNGSAPGKKTTNVTAVGNKRKKEPVERKRKPPKGKQVSFVLGATEKIAEQEGTSQVHQAVDERNLVEKVDFVAQGDTSPNDSTPTDTDYKILYLEAQKKIEDLMEDNIDLMKELNFAFGKIEAYEKMMVTMGFAIPLSSQGGVPAPNNAPDTSRNHQNVSSPTPKCPSPMKRGRYKKKAKA